MEIGPNRVGDSPPHPLRLPAPPPIAAGLDRDMGDPAGACPTASGVARECVAGPIRILMAEHQPWFG
jgi:hypothetical protein